MQVAQFKIEPGKEEEIAVEKVDNYAGVYFSVKVEGHEIAMPGSIDVEQDGICFLFGSVYHTEIGEHKLQLNRFGMTRMATSMQSDWLIKIKPKLESLFLALGQKLVAAKEIFDKKDLQTSKVLPASVAIEYAFIEPKIETVTEIVKQRSRIFFTYLPPQPNGEIVGSAGKFDVCLRRHINNGWSPATQTLYFTDSGWITAGVDAMRAQHSDDDIRAAFQDLTEKLLKAEATPTDVEQWTATTVTKVELTKD